jgi:hypothetical protein
MKFCGECGKSLSDPAAPVRSPDPRNYTPKHLAVLMDPPKKDIAPS